MPSAYCAQLTRDLLAIAKFLFYSLEYPVKRPLNTSLPNEAQYAYLVCLEKYVELFQFRTLYLILGGEQPIFEPCFGSGPFVGGLCAETGHFFEILKQAGHEEIV